MIPNNFWIGLTITIILFTLLVIGIIWIVMLMNDVFKKRKMNLIMEEQENLKINKKGMRRLR